MSLLNQLIESSSMLYGSCMMSVLDDSCDNNDTQIDIKESKEQKIETPPPLPTILLQTHIEINQNQGYRSIFDLGLSSVESNTPQFLSSKDRFKKISRMVGIAHKKIIKLYYQFFTSMEFCAKQQKRKQMERVCSIITDTLSIIHQKRLDKWIEAIDLKREFGLILSFSNKKLAGKRIFGALCKKFREISSQGYQQLKKCEKFVIKIDFLSSAVAKYLNCTTFKMKKLVLTQIYQHFCKIRQQGRRKEMNKVDSENNIGQSNKMTQQLNLVKQVKPILSVKTSNPKFLPQTLELTPKIFSISTNLLDKSFKSTQFSVQNLPQKLPVAYSQRFQVEIPDIHDSMNFFLTMTSSCNASQANIGQFLTKRSSITIWNGSQILPSEKLNDISEIKDFDGQLNQMKDIQCQQDAKQYQSCALELSIPEDLFGCSQSKIASFKSKSKQICEDRMSMPRKISFDQTLEHQYQQKIKSGHRSSTSQSNFQKQTDYSKNIENEKNKKFLKPRLSINQKTYKLKEHELFENSMLGVQKSEMRAKKSLTIAELERDKKMIQGLIEEIRRSNGKNVQKTNLKEGSASEQRLLQTIDKISKLDVVSCSKKMYSKIKEDVKSSANKDNIPKNRQTIQVHPFDETISLGQSYEPLFQNPILKMMSAATTKRQIKPQNTLKNYYDYQTQKKKIKGTEVVSRSANQQKKCISLKMKRSKQISNFKDEPASNYHIGYSIGAFKNKENSNNKSKERIPTKIYVPLRQEETRYSNAFKQRW